MSFFLLKVAQLGVKLAIGFLYVSIFRQSATPTHDRHCERVIAEWI
jgi:hypothetical protein